MTSAPSPDRLGPRRAGGRRDRRTSTTRARPAPAVPADIRLARPLTPLVERRIETVTGLRPPHGPAEVAVRRPADVDPRQHRVVPALLGPLLDRWARRPPRRRTAASHRPQVAGAELGALLGWMSTRVLGQYDILVGRQPSDDAVYLVAPNLADIEQRYGFDPSEFRTWVLLHELTHRAQFTGVPWMREHFTGLVDQSLSFADPDPAAFVAAMRSALRNRRDAAMQVRDGGVLGLIAPPEQRAVMAQHRRADVAARRPRRHHHDPAAGALVPNAERFERILRERRRTSNPLSRTVLRLAGIEAKLNQYAAGVRFIDAIEAERGDRAVDRCWSGPEQLPTLEEVRAPATWLGAHGGRRCRRWPGRRRLVADLLARCTFPPAGTAVTCAVSGGADSPALLVLAVAAGCAVTAVHVDHGLRDGLGCRGRAWSRRSPTGSAPRSAPHGRRWATARTSRPEPAPPGTPCSPPTCSPATPPTTRPRRCW